MAIKQSLDTDFVVFATAGCCFEASTNSNLLQTNSGYSCLTTQDISFIVKNFNFEVLN